MLAGETHTTNSDQQITLYNLSKHTLSLRTEAASGGPTPACAPSASQADCQTAVRCAATGAHARRCCLHCSLDMRLERPGLHARGLGGGPRSMRVAVCLASPLARLPRRVAAACCSLAVYNDSMSPKKDARGSGASEKAHYVSYLKARRSAAAAALSPSLAHCRWTHAAVL